MRKEEHDYGKMEKIIQRIISITSIKQHSDIRQEVGIEILQTEKMNRK